MFWGTPNTGFEAMIERGGMGTLEGDLDYLMFKMDKLAEP